MSQENPLDEVEVTLTLSAHQTASLMNALAALRREHGLEEHAKLKAAIGQQFADELESHFGGGTNES